ncbi:hypothetical protein RJT34_14850 [Clitoria ternatea]|uniref:DNA-directed RNA polymerase I subunit rpa49 n=1 Tax=Clitoria ternatea TaxID=43366 RepID=A0AAN9JTB6_CLITE
MVKVIVCSPMDSESEDMKSQLEPSPTKKSKNKKNKMDKDKDVAPQPNQIKVKVEVVREHPNKTPPIVGYFPSGFDPCKNYGDNAGPSEFQVYRHRNMNKRLQLVVRPTSSPVEFVGTSYSGEAAAVHRAMYALGVLDKEAGTLKIVPVAGNKIFRLEPKVKGIADKEPESSTVEEMTWKKKAAAAAQTTVLWGTKKAVEQAKKKQALRQDEGPDALKNLDVKMKDVVINKNALASTEAHISRNIPPYDASATTPQEAYILDKIILKGEWDYLEDIYTSLHQGEANFSAYPTFVRNRIGKLKEIKDEPEKKKLSCIFSYINHLIKFKIQHSFNASSAKGHKIPAILHHKFTTMFAVSESRRWSPLSPEKLNLLISYVLVLTLFSDEFRTDYTDIAKDLSMTTLPVRQLYEHLGCKISRQKDEQKNLWVATLPVPLAFPGLEQKQKKRKR